MNNTQFEVLAAIAAHPGEMSPVLLDHLLRGQTLGRMAEKGLLESPHFGRLAGEAVMPEINAAESAGLVSRAGGFYAALSLTARGQGKLAFEQAVREGKTAPEVVASDAAYEAYWNWRRDLARSLGKPAYRVLPNQVLTKLAQLQPATLEELLVVPGLGKGRVMQHQTALLAVGQQLRGIAPAAAEG